MDITIEINSFKNNNKLRTNRNGLIKIKSIDPLYHSVKSESIAHKDKKKTYTSPTIQLKIFIIYTYTFC